MNKKLLVMSVCIALSLPTMAQRRASAKVKAPATWAESTILIRILEGQTDDRSFL